MPTGNLIRVKKSKRHKTDHEEVLNSLWIVAVVALSADPLHLFDLISLAGRLDVFEVNIGVLAEVYYSPGSRTGLQIQITYVD